MAIEIENQLADAGYSMLGDKGSIGNLILSILKSENTRYLKAIPFLIYKYGIDSILINNVDKKTQKLFSALMEITKRIFQELNISRNIPEHLNFKQEELDSYLKKNSISYNEFRDEFELQLRNENKPSLFIDRQKIYAERELQMYLSQLFTKKEKHIIKRLLEDKPISRTDYEYYSRKTKKKLMSIIGLQDFAKTIYAKTPGYDENLFRLKKKLEEFLEEKSEKEISIQKFFIWDKDKISISYKKKGIEDQLFHTMINLSEIKDNEILNLLNKYKEHDFQ